MVAILALEKGKARLQNGCKNKYAIRLLSGPHIRRNFFRWLNYLVKSFQCFSVCLLSSTPKMGTFYAVKSFAVDKIVSFVTLNHVV